MASDTDRFHKHSEYVFREHIWKRIADLLQGDDTCLKSKKYLWEHAIEQTDRQCEDRDIKEAQYDRQLREQRTQYVNYIKMVEERFVSLMMKGGFNVPQEITAMFDGEETNVDGQERDLEEFATVIARDLIDYGVGYVMTDAQTINARNRMEEREAGARPYLSHIHPLDLQDWQIGSQGQYTAFRYEYKLLVPRETLESEPVLAHYTTIASLYVAPENIPVVRGDEVVDIEQGQTFYLLKTYVSVDEEGLLVNHHPSCKKEEHHNWQLLNETPIPELDELPLATNRVQDSCLEPVVPIALKIYNKQSDLDNILHNQCYDRSFGFGDLGGALDEAGNITSDSAKQLMLSTKSFVWINDPAGKVEKLEPTNPEALIGSIQSDIGDLFKVAFNQTRMSKPDSATGESAETKREAKEDLITRVQRLRERLLSIMNKAIKDYAMFKSQNAEFDSEIGFNEELTEADLTELTSFVRGFTDRFNRYEGLTKEIDKKLIAHLNLPNEEDLRKEIDSKDISQDIDPVLQATAMSKSKLEGIAQNGRQARKVSQGNSSKRQENKSVSK